MQMESQVLQINIDDIIPNRFQPRVAFDEKALNELAASIKEHGIIQPLVLRKLGDKYEIIAGERRYKAATLAGLTTVPAVISNIDDNKSAEVALVENVQRRDLTPIEEARSYKNLLDKGYLTQDDLAKKMGLSQATIANKLRLLNLDDRVQQALLENKISERHARALLVLKDKEEQNKWLERIINERMTVRQLDQELKKVITSNSDDSSDVPLVNLTPSVEEMKENANDLNPVKEQTIESMMVPENTMTEYSESLPQENTNVLENQVQQSSIEQQSAMPNKFFNPLESVPASMDINNPFQTESTFNTNPEPPKEDIEVFDMPFNPQTIVPEEPKEEAPKIMNSANELELNPNNKFFQPEMNVSEPTTFVEPLQEQTLINPMDFVETLEPTDNNNNVLENQPLQEQITQPQPVVDQQDVVEETLEPINKNYNESINEIKNLITNLQNKGVGINLTETDLGNSYQINITIQKDIQF